MPFFSPPRDPCCRSASPGPPSLEGRRRRLALTEGRSGAICRNETPFRNTRTREAAQAISKEDPEEKRMLVSRRTMLMAAVAALGTAAAVRPASAQEGY